MLPSAAPHLVIELTDALFDLLRLVQQDGISLRAVWRKQVDRSEKLTEDTLLIQYHVKISVNVQLTAFVSELKVTSVPFNTYDDYHGRLK